MERKNKHLHCKSFNTKINPLMEGSCTVNLVTQKQHFHGKDLHRKHSYTQTNTFMERSCNVNLLTQLQTLSWKRGAL